MLNKIAKARIVRDLLLVVNKDNKGYQIANVQEANELIRLLDVDGGR